MAKLLIVDDEERMRQLLTIYLNEYFMEIDEAADGHEAVKKTRDKEYDVIILDVMMPYADGWEALKRIRETSDVQILMLTAKGDTEDKVIGLTAGADDYLVKPFNEEELIARIQTMLRRANKKKDEKDYMAYKGVSLHFDSREAYYEDKLLKLTQTEFDILSVLIRNKGKVFSREQLIEHVWGIEFMGEDRTIDSHIKNLREKLKASGLKEQLVQTVWGIGYKVQ